MKKGSLILKILVVVIAGAVGLLATFYVNGYFDVWSSVLRVNKVEVNVNVAQNGIAHIVEHDYYTFTKPYHGLAPFMSLPSNVTMSNFKLSVSGATIQKTDGYANQNGFDLRVYLNDGYTIPKVGGDNVLMTLNYDVTGGFQNGTNFSQFFYKFWGKSTPSWVPELIVNYTFPQSFVVQKIFPHPIDVQHQVIKNGNNSFTIIYHNVPPNTYAEARFVFPPTSVQYHSILPMTLNQIQNIENTYSNGTTWQWFLIALFIILIILIPLIFRILFGIEPKVDLHSEYEREIPYKDSPELVNSIVRRLVEEPDSDGFAATMLDLVDKGYLEFSGNNAFKLLNGAKPLSESEKMLYDTVIKPFATNGVFDPRAVQESMKGNVQRAQKFNEAYTSWKMKVADDAEMKNYLLTYGNTITKIVTVITLMILPSIFIFWNFSSGRAYPELFMIFSWVALADWISAWIIMMIPRDIFGRWTKDGREYYLRWKNFEKYLMDYSLIKEKPPESVVLWRQYLIYGTSLGIAKHVIKAIKEVNPPEIVESDPFFPAFTTMLWYDSIIFLPQAAMMNSVNVQQGSNMGNFGGGGFGGNVGGGFGGGGRGGF